MFRSICLLIILTLFVAACTTPPPETTQIFVSLIADGRERTYAYDTPITVGEFLRDAEVELGDLDRVNPQEFAQISEGMLVTVVRVQEETTCEEVEIPFRQRTVPNEGLAPGEERLGQPGQNGVERVCYRVRIENSVRQDPVETSRVVISSAEDEVVYVGPTGEIDPVPITGTLAYISNNNAWVMRGSSTTKRPITTTGDLDERVFALSNDGSKLLFSRAPSGDEDGSFFNELWSVANVSAVNSEPVRLVPRNVLFADWVPSQTNTISYSTGERSDAAPGWRAFNDLWTMRINPQTGESLNIDQVVEQSSGGLYGWWGTNYFWSPDGSQVAWVRADSMGLVDLTNGAFNPLVEYPVFNTRQSWSWRATVSWSADSSLLATTVHVPIGNYPPETSPAFSVAVAASDGSFDTPVVDNSGIWSNPQYAPPGTDYLAHLRARDPFNSINGEYDLVVSDRDGSNAFTVFPEGGQPGLTAQTFQWSPDGRQIALIYQGNLWIVEVETGVNHQLTLDGGASQPVWSQ